MVGSWRRWRFSTCVIVLSFVLSGGLVLRAYIGDASTDPPPTSGTYAFNTFVPPNTPGASYIDPVFGSTVRRLTTDHNGDDIYARNMWWSADGSRYLHNDQVINTATGVVTHKGVPRGDHGFDKGFDSADPNVIFYFSGSTLRKITLAADGTFTDAVYFTAPATLANLGGSINWLDANGRYMVLRYGSEPSVHVFDRQNLSAGPYANAINGSIVESGGYVGLTPDGKFVVAGSTSYSINHTSRTLSTSGTTFWSLCGDHGSFMSASDGRNYKITTNCYDAPEYWAVDITNNAAGLSASAQKALPNNRRLLTLPSWNFDAHISSAAKGANRDWAFFSVEDSTDGFNGGVSGWLPYRSEIIGINVMTSEVRRLAHHRSRGTGSNDATGYYYQPRVSSSWGAEYVGWASDFNQAGISDIFATPFGGTSLRVPTAPTNLRITQ